MDPIKEIPWETQFIASAALASRRRARLSNALKLGEALQDLRLRQLEEVVSVIGKDRYADYAQLRSRTRQQMRSLETEPSIGSGQTSNRLKSRQDRLGATREALSSIGLDSDRIKAIHREYAKRARDLVETSANEQQVLFAAGAPAGTQVTPPYLYESTYAFDDGSIASQRTVSTYANRTTGYFSTKTAISISNASNSEFAEADASGGVGFQFVMPSAGRLTVTVSLEASNVRYFGSLSDEWGVSGLMGELWLRCYANVVNPGLDVMGGEQRLNYTVVLDGEDEASWSRAPFAPNDLVPRAFVSDQLYSAGTVLYVECGVSQRNWFWVNDFTCSSEIDSDWTVKGVFLTVAP
jgi:hypothetical protein